MALVDNAIKFSPKGGEVEFHISTKDDKVHVAVEDHGIGIKKENLPRSLIVFITLKNMKTTSSEALDWVWRLHARLSNNIMEAWMSPASPAREAHLPLH